MREDNISELRTLLHEVERKLAQPWVMETASVVRHDAVAIRARVQQLDFHLRTLQDTLEDMTNDHA